jgi:hypothetical protein
VRRTALVLALALFPIHSLAQVALSSGQVARDHDALNVVQGAVNALGGAAAIGQVQSWQAQGQLTSVAPDKTAITGTITWEMAGPELLLASTTNRGPGAFLTGHGAPAMVSNAKSWQLPSHVMASIFIPALAGSILLNDLQNTSFQLRFLGKKTLGQESVSVVRIMATGVPDFEDTAQTWYFDATTNLPIRVEFRIPSMQRPEVGQYGAFALSDFQTASGVLYPHQIVNFRQGKQIGSVTLQAVKVNPTLPSSDFDPPAASAQ